MKNFITLLPGRLDFARKNYDSPNSIVSSKYLRAAIFSFLLVFGYAQANAQITTATRYTFQSFSGTYTPVVGGTPTGPNILADDNVQQNIPIGFTFNFCGIDYTTLSASSNGFISLTNDDNSDNGNGTFEIEQGWLFPLWDDLYGAVQTPPGPTPPNSSYIVTGTAPNRVFTLEWNTWGFYNGPSTTPRVSFEIKLYETTNLIQYCYNNISNYASASFSIGIGNSPNDWQALTSTSATPTTDTLNFTSSLNTLPATGQIYQFAPPEPCSGVPQAPNITTTFSTPVCSGNTATLSLYDPNITTRLHYLWQVGTSPTGPWMNIPNAPNATTYTTPSLTSASYYRVGDSCEISHSVTYSAGFTVPVNTYTLPYTEDFSTTPNLSLPVCYSHNTTNSQQSFWYVVNNLFRDNNGVLYPHVVIEDDKIGNGDGKNAFFTLPELSLKAGDIYKISFGYERGNSLAITTNLGVVYPENLQLFENFNVQPPTSGQGSPGGTSLFNTFNLTTDGHNAASLTFTPTEDGGYFFSWYSDVPHPSTPGTGVQTGIPGGFIAVDNIAIDSIGCNLPAIKFQPQNAAVCLNNTATLSVSATGYGLTYQWYKNGSLLSNGQHVSGATTSTLVIDSAAAADAGYYRVAVTGSCGGSTTIQSSTDTLKVSDYPTNTVTASGPTAFCSGDSVVLTAHTTSANVSYQWMENGNLVPGIFSDTFTVMNTDSVQSIVTNATGCATPSVKIPVSVLSTASITVSPSGPTTFCHGDSVKFVANYNPSIHYVWLNNGDTLSPSNTTDSLTTKTSGVFTLRETTGNNCSVTFPTPFTVVVNGPTIVPTITADGPLSFCVGGFVTFETPFVNLPGYGYQWYQSGVPIPGATDTSYTASAPGPITVSVSQNSCLLSSLPDTVHVDAPPTTITNNGTIICSGNTVTLTAPGGPGTLYYLWYKNGISTGVPTQSYSTTVGGTFAVRVTDAFPCTSTSSSVTVTEGAPPSAVLLATGPTTFCPGDSVTIKANLDTSLNYTWFKSTTGLPGSYTALPYPPDMPNGHMDTSKTFKESGYYMVYEANGPCGDTSDPMQVIVSSVPAPTIVVSGTASLCPGGSVTLSTQTGTNLTYQWLKSGVAIPFATGATYVANDSGTLTVSVTNGPGCTGVSPSKIVTINPYPADSIMVLGSVDSICAGNTTTLIAPAGAGYVYQWNRDNTPIPSATSASYIATAGGNYTATVTSAAGCVATTATPTTITVLPVPTASIFAASSTTFCTGESVVLSTSAGNGLTYQWRNGLNGNIPGATSNTLTVDTTGSYFVVISNGVCTVGSAEIAVTVNAAPPVNIIPAGNTSICQGNSVMLNASTVPGATYQWRRNNQNIAVNGTSQSYNANVSGSYTVVASSNNCMATSAAQNVTVNALPLDTIISDPINTHVTCAGSPLVLKDEYGYTGFTYQWKWNGANVANANLMTFGALDSGLYTVVVTDTNGCISSSSSYEVATRAIPDPAVVVNGSVLTTGTFITYQWYLNDIPLPNTDENSITATSSGRYKVTVTDGFGCKATSDETPVNGVGVKNVNNNNVDVRIYPNPATSVVHIEAPIRVNVSVAGLDGKVILQSNDATQIDLSQLANGVYMITVYDESNTAIKVDKLVKVGL